jgi:hypothetical protein
MNLINKNRLNALLLLTVAFVGCKKSYLDTKPSDAITPEKAYESIAALNSSATGAYLSVFEYTPQTGGGAMHDAYGQKSIDLANDLMGNDMIVHTQGYGWYNADYQYTAWTLPNGVRTRSDITWTFYYDLIKQANLALDNTKNLPSPTADQLAVIGEFLAIRAWSYFGLINNFQQTFKGNENTKGVPLYTSLTTPKGRGTVQEVYTQIIQDLTKAEQYLNGRVRASKVRIDASVIRGIRARVALAMEDYPTAANYANLARQGYTLMTNTVYQSRSGFSKIDNAEWMWGSLIPADQATIFASFYSHIDATQFGYAQLGGQKKIPKALYDKIPTGDIRKNVFRAPGTGTATLPDYTQTKFAVPTVGSWAADYLYMRAAEMFLIEAEALARQGQDAAAITVLESLVKPRFAAYTASALSGTALIDEILLQRRIELWGEGFSLFDIKRTKVGLNRPTGSGNHGAPNFNPIVLTLPNASPLFLMRIPQRELDNNPNMTPGDQNP